MTINVTDTFAPSSGNNTFPIVVDINVKNGYKVVADHASRNAIDPRLLTVGALVGVVNSDGTGTFAVYRYLGGSPSVDTNWLVQPPESTIIWRPNGTGDATTFADVMALMKQRLGAVVIQCDQKPGVYTIPAGSYPMNPGSYFFNPRPQNSLGISAEDGVTFLDLAGLDGLFIEANNTAQEFFNFTVPAGGGVEFFLRNNGNFDNEGSVVAYTLQSNLYLRLSSDGGFSSGGAAVFDVYGSLLLVSATNMSTATYEAADFIDTAGTGTLSLTHDGTGFPWPYTSTITTYLNTPTSQDGGYGPTSFRPSNVAGNQRTNYWDTDVGIPIVWNGAAWVSETPQIVWRADGSGTATTWAQVVAQITLFQGPSIIYVDDAGGYTVPAGTYDMKMSSLIGPTPSGPLSSVVSIATDDGVTFQNLPYVSGVEIDGSNSVAPLFTYDAATVLVLDNGASLTNDGAAALQFAFGEIGAIYVKNNSTLELGSVDVAVSSGVTIWSSNAGVPIASDALTGAGAVSLAHDGIALRTLSGFSGTFTNNPTSLNGGSGPTAQRPVTDGANSAGMTYYDTTTVQYLVWNGTTWKIVTLT